MLIWRRNGRKHYTRNCNDKCYDCRPLRFAGFQSYATGLRKGEDGNSIYTAEALGLDGVLTSTQVFLERSGARVINTDTLKPPNPDCSVCGVTQSRLVVDPARATLNDLVEDVLKLKLGYGEEFSINNEIGTIYDPELEDNLSKKFSDLGVKGDSFLTVIDDDEVNPRVNLSLSISEQ